MGGMIERETGELMYSPGEPLQARMMSRKPMDLALNDQPGVLGPWEEFQQPVYLNDKAYFPIYRMMTMLGGDAEWDGVSWEVTVIAPWGSRWKVPIGGQDVRNEEGTTIATLSDSTLIVNRRVLVPFDFWSTITGYRVEWDRSTKSLLVVTEPLFRPDDPVEGYGASDTGYVMADLNVRMNDRYVRLTHMPINYRGLIYYPLELGAEMFDFTAEYDSEARRLMLTTDRVIKDVRPGQWMPSSSQLSAVPVDAIPSVQYSIDGVQTDSSGMPLQFTSPFVVHRSKLYVPMNELAGIAGYRVDYVANGEKTLHLSKPIARLIREKLAPNVSRDDVRILLGNRLKVVYDAEDGTRSWQYRFITDSYAAQPELESGSIEKAGAYELAAVDVDALQTGQLNVQLFVHHEPSGATISGYTMYTNTPNGIQKTRVNADGSVVEQLISPMTH